MFAECLLMLSRVTKFSVHRRESFPSAHSPSAITMNLPGTDIVSLGIRAQHLGNHAVLRDEGNANRRIKNCNGILLKGSVPE